MVGDGDMIAVFVDHDGFVAVRSLRKGREDGDGLSRAAERKTRETND